MSENRRAGRSEVALASPLSVILIGRNDADALGAGWHPVQEGPAGIPCRWMSPQATVRLPGIDTERAIRGLCITISAPAIIQGYKPGLSVYGGEQLLAHCSDLGDEGTWNVAVLQFIKSPIHFDSSSDQAKNASMTLAMETFADKTATPLAFIPHEAMANGDLRELGALVSSIKVIYK